MHKYTHLRLFNKRIDISNVYLSSCIWRHLLLHGWWTPGDLLTCWPELNCPDQFVEVVKLDLLSDSRNFSRNFVLVPVFWRKLTEAFRNSKVINMFLIQVVSVWGTLTYFLWHFRGKCTDLLLPIISPRSYIIHGILLHAVCTHTPPPRSYYCVLSGWKIKPISSFISRTCWRNLNGWSDLYSYITPARAHACALTSAGRNRDLDAYPASCCWNPHRWPSAAASSIPCLHRPRRRSVI